MKANLIFLSLFVIWGYQRSYTQGSFWVVLGSMLQYLDSDAFVLDKIKYLFTCYSCHSVSASAELHDIVPAKNRITLGMC